MLASGLPSGASTRPSRATITTQPARRPFRPAAAHGRRRARAAGPTMAGAGARAAKTAAGQDSEPDSQTDCDPRHTAPAPPRRIIARGRAAHALTGTGRRAIVPPSVFARSEPDTDGRGWGGA